MAKYWMGQLSDECQLCSGSFGVTMYDCAIRPYGMWGNICKGCFLESGSRLGIGLGQEYKKQKSGKWLLVKGNK